MTPIENPRVGGSIPSLRTLESLIKKAKCEGSPVPWVPRISWNPGSSIRNVSDSHPAAVHFAREATVAGGREVAGLGTEVPILLPLHRRNAQAGRRAVDFPSQGGAAAMEGDGMSDGTDWAPAARQRQGPGETGAKP